EMRDILRRSGQEVIHPDHLVAIGEETFAEMGAEEPRGTGDENAHPGHFSYAVTSRSPGPPGYGLPASQERYRTPTSRPRASRESIPRASRGWDGNLSPGMQPAQSS